MPPGFRKVWAESSESRLPNPSKVDSSAIRQSSFALDTQTDVSARADC